MEKTSSTAKSRANRPKIRIEPASATEIRAALGIRPSEVRIATRAVRIASGTTSAKTAVKGKHTPETAVGAPVSDAAVRR